MRMLWQRPQNISAQIIRSVTDPLQNFMHNESASGILLLAVTLITLWWANSSHSLAYFEMLHLEVAFRMGPLELAKGLQHWVNDGLMVIFFFVVGLEIKRELFIGELSSLKKAALPIFAAIGGVIAPALIYSYFNSNTPTASGWAVPMATDIAFAVGVLTLLGTRVPFALKIFLLALAIIDDLIAVIVIALFYTQDIHQMSLFYSLAMIAFIALLNFSGIRSRLIYVLFGIFVWLAVLKSGVHATIAGVVLGLLCPIQALIPRDEMKKLIASLANSCDDRNESERIEEMRLILKEAQSPLDQLIRTLHLWVAFLIMPLFALFNAGVAFQFDEIPGLFSQSIGLGVILGLVFGKPIGIALMAFISTKLGLAELPDKVRWPHIIGVGCIAGIGFTMALFLANLSFAEPSALNAAKLSILLASFISAALGAAVLLVVGQPR